MDGEATRVAIGDFFFRLARETIRIRLRLGTKKKKRDERSIDRSVGRSNDS
tara:strand:- start:1726 stop:1878 length:153 start_codon:yes stop_codon:yes gene_type:complete